METRVNIDDKLHYMLNTGEHRVIDVNTSAMLTSNFPIELVQIGDHVCYHEITQFLNNKMYVTFHISASLFQL